MDRKIIMPISEKKQLYTSVVIKNNLSINSTNNYYHICARQQLIPDICDIVIQYIPWDYLLIDIMRSTSNETVTDTIKKFLRMLENTPVVDPNDRAFLLSLYAVTTLLLTINPINLIMHRYEKNRIRRFNKESLKNYTFRELCDITNKLYHKTVRRLEISIHKTTLINYKYLIDMYEQRLRIARENIRQKRIKQIKIQELIEARSRQMGRVNVRYRHHNSDTDTDDDTNDTD